MEADLPRHTEHGSCPKKAWIGEKKDRDNRKSRMNTPLEQVLMQIKDDPSLKWLGKMKGDPNKCNRNKYCYFHRDHG